MKNKILSSLLLGSLLLSGACQKERDPEKPLQADLYARALHNHPVAFQIGPNHLIDAWLSKPAGEQMDLVIGLHGGTATLEKSKSAAKSFAQLPDAGQLFLPKHAFLSLAYTEFNADGSIADRGYAELEEVVTVIDQIYQGYFKDGFQVDKLLTFGTSRGGGLALLAAIERKLTAAISAEGPLDWIATKKAIDSGKLAPTFLELAGFEESTAAWGNPDIDSTDWIKFSPGLRLDSFQSPALIISGEEDRVILIETAVDMQARYQQCENCHPGIQFVLHPHGHTDWATNQVKNRLGVFLMDL